MLNTLKSEWTKLHTTRSFWWTTFIFLFFVWGWAILNARLTQPAETPEDVELGMGIITPDGAVTFTPDKQFVGKPDSVIVKRVDKNGTPVTATYSPEFTKVTPTGSGDKTEGLQGQVQEGKVTFTPGHDSVPFPANSTPLFDNHSTVKEVQNVGKFEVDADGKVTFTPDKQFKGETPELELTRTDVNGTSVTVKYQAVVKEVTPTGTTATSTGSSSRAWPRSPTATRKSSWGPTNPPTSRPPTATGWRTPACCR